MVLEVAHARKRNLLSNLDKILQNGICISDVITYANLDNDRLRGLGVAGVQILSFPTRRLWSSNL